MTTFLSSLEQYYHRQVERHRNRPFLDAAMAACALVAAVGGKVSFRQRTRLDQVLETLEALEVFDPHEGVESFNRFVETLAADPSLGRAQVLEAITGEVSEHPEKADLLIRICLAVSEVDGAVPPRAREEILSLCDILGVDAGSFVVFNGDEIFPAR